jgi:hypothetical protein
MNLAAAPPLHDRTDGPTRGDIPQQVLVARRFL